MRADIGKDAAILLLAEKPVRTSGNVRPVGAEPQGLHNPTDSAGLHQLPCLDRTRRIVVFRVADREDASGFGLDLSNFSQLLKRRDSRFIRHEVLAAPHGANAKRTPIGRDRRAQDHLDTLVFKYFVFARCHWNAIEAPGKRRRQIWLRRKPLGELGSARQHVLDLAVNVAMVDPNHAKPDRLLHWN